MKKTYSKPLSKVFAVKMTSIICTSVGMSSGSADNTSALSRGFDWDDDEEDFE
jgi:hypothetical protein